MKKYPFSTENRLQCLLWSLLIKTTATATSTLVFFLTATRLSLASQSLPCPLLWLQITANPRHLTAKWIYLQREAIYTSFACMLKTGEWGGKSENHHPTRINFFELTWLFGFLSLTDIFHTSLNELKQTTKNTSRLCLVFPNLILKKLHKNRYVYVCFRAEN